MYWHDSLHPGNYLSKNIFLADANQENTVNATEVSRFSQIDNLVLVKFNQDTVVIPTDSEWFGFYEDNQDKQVVPAQALPIWSNLRLDYSGFRMQILECRKYPDFTGFW